MVTSIWRKKCRLLKKLLRWIRSTYHTSSDFKLVYTFLKILLMQFSKDQDFFYPGKNSHPPCVLKKSTIESDMKDDNCLKSDVWIKQWNVSTYPGYWILVMMSRRQTNQLTMAVRRGSVMATILILTLVTSPAVGMIPSNLSVMRLKRQITDEASGLRITDLWLKLLFDWFPNFFPGQLMTTPVLFMPQVRCFFFQILITYI